MSNADQYIALYEQQVDTIRQHSATALNAHRDEAFARFRAKGFPTNKHENYLRCPILKDLETDYGLNLKQLPFAADEKNLFRCNVPGVKAHNAFLLNDQLHFSEALPQGVVLCSLSEACQRYPEIVAKHLGKKTNSTDDAFVAFNGTFAQNGYFLYLPKNAALELPIQLVNVLHATTDLMTATHNLVVLEQGATLRMLVCDHTLAEVNFFASRVTEIFVGENARFDLYALESTNDTTAQISQIFVEQAANSQTTFDCVSLHNGHTRNHIEIDLAAEGAETWLGGMVAADGTQKCDNFTVIRHLAPHCTSNELFKYILDGEAEGAFAGQILVEKGAQKTSAYQTNRNICLSKTAHMHAKPQLEIYADDVKCGHGATTGQLDENALFYMRTRGIGYDEARMLLLLAFASDVLDRIAVTAVRDRLRMMVEQRLRGNDAKCNACTTKNGGCPNV